MEEHSICPPRNINCPISPSNRRQANSFGMPKHMSHLSKRSKIRVVLADSEDARREGVMISLLSAQMFDVVAIACTPAQCADLVHEMIPELVVCPDGFLSGYSQGEKLFPLFVVLGPGELSVPRVVCRISDHKNAGRTNEALAAAASAVLTLKAADLSKLIEHYVQFGGQAAPEESLDVEKDGVRRKLLVSDIQWIEAAGNYALIHTNEEVFDIREPITKLSSRLQRHGFIRTHRRVIVNTSAIAARVLEGEIVAGLQLSDGTRVPVGPTFREDIPTDMPIRHEQPQYL